MNLFCMRFGYFCLLPDEVKDSDVLEVGSLNVNGSFRKICDEEKPKSYIGVDIVAGDGVDEICSIHNLVERFGRNSFDYVIATEILEHIEDWKSAIRNLKDVCREDGCIILTTRSKGFPYHGCPSDFWRYEKDDIRKIFADFHIYLVEDDITEPGVMAFVQKHKNYVPDEKCYELELTKVEPFMRDIPFEKMDISNLSGYGSTIFGVPIAHSWSELYLIERVFRHYNCQAVVEMGIWFGGLFFGRRVL